MKLFLKMFFNCAMIIKIPVSSNQDLIPDIFLAGGTTYSPNWQKEALEI